MRLRALIFGLAIIGLALVPIPLGPKVFALVLLAPSIAGALFRRRAVNSVSAPRHADAPRVTALDTLTLRVWFHENSTEFDAIVLTGRFSGRTLSSLEESELLTLLLEISDVDPSGVLLVETFLDQHHPDWNKEDSVSSEDSNEPPSSTSMSRREARRVLGVSAEASEAEIVAAHRDLIKIAHPDRGGLTHLAKLANQARDALLGNE